ncbi:MAG: signal recognition particle-docking protein FtsY [Acutalibacteraceae bacterium]|nr:signal recognition particle-docking protein FtsY [Acutalibacteraceae bacterium]
MGLFSKISKGLKKTRDSLTGAVNSVISSFTKIDDELFEELEETLILADTGVNTANAICEELRSRVKAERVTDPELITDMLKQVVVDMMSADNKIKTNTKPSMILVIGVNGVGKTTSIGKMANMYKAQGKSVILGAADTFRAAAAEQLTIWADRAGVPIVKHAEGADPSAVVFDTISAAKSRGADVIICDTAGRLHNKKNLMDELSKMSRIISRELPEADVEVLLVLDATTGQNAVNQAREFQQAAGITGIILTKLDGTARGGVVLAINQELNIPVKLIGVGEQIDDLQDFSAEDFANALFSGDNK